MKKSALTGARFGHEIQVFGVDQRRAWVQSMGPVTIERVHVPPVLRAAQNEANARRQTTRRDIELEHQRFRAYRIESETAIAELKLGRPNSSQLKWGARLLGKVDRERRAMKISRIRNDVKVRDGERHSAVAMLRARMGNQEPVQNVEFKPDEWARILPEMVDLEVAMSVKLKEYDPDIVYAHDFTALPCAARYVMRRRAAGHEAKLVYDAHEFLRGVDLVDSRKQRAYELLESIYIGVADEIITVSPDLARLLQDAHSLSNMPTVVHNAPVAQQFGTRGEVPSLRETIGLSSTSAPLAVYSGGVNERRGLDVLLEAVSLLPGVHLAIVTDDRVRFAELVSSADQASAFGRIHQAPYVEPGDVATYLSGATVGVHPLPRSNINHEIALPNKLFEYLHARLPVVVSDVEAMSTFVSKHGVGQVFRSGDAQSLAEAVQSAMANQAAHCAAISSPLLSEYSWEGQEVSLAGVYERLTGQAVSVSESIPLDTRESKTDSTWLAEAVSEKAVGRVGGKSLIIGPRNLAGQAYEWSLAVEAHTDHSALSFCYQRDGSIYRFPVHSQVSERTWNDLSWQLRQAREVLGGRFTHALMESGHAILGTLNGGLVPGDLPSLRRAGIEVGVVLHGSEIRDPHLHALSEPESPFPRMQADAVALLASRVERTKRALEGFGGPIFYSTPGLGEYVQGFWLPVVTRSSAVLESRTMPGSVGSKIRVLHVSTSSDLKASNEIGCILQDLEDEGLITYMSLSGVPVEEIDAALAECDVFVDGLRLGDYGVAACEALAAGRVVIGHVAPGTREAFSELPIVEANIGSLRDTIVELALARADLAAIGYASWEFWRKYHDGELSAEVLGEVLLSRP